MNPTLSAALRAWTFDPTLIACVSLTALIYARGWKRLRQRGARWPSNLQGAAFLLGLATLFVALASPLDAYGNLSLAVHMLQHVLLMLVAPALLWIGRPARVLELGLPLAMLTAWVNPIRQANSTRRVLASLEQPVLGSLLFVAAMWTWHLPAFYELALVSRGWHQFEHLTFLFAGLVFWRPVVGYLSDNYAGVVRPYWLLPYLFLTDIAGTLLSAVLAFSNRVLYSHYAALPGLGNISPLDDQALAGALMWVLGSMAFLAPAAWIGFRLLTDAQAAHPAWAVAGGAVSARTLSARAERSPAALPTAQGATTLLLIVNSTQGGLGECSRTPVGGRPLPLAGWLLRSRRLRMVARFALLILAALIVVDGLTGPPVAAMNLAGVLPWVQWRGVAVLSLLLLGNVLCASCPLPLAGRFSRRWHRPRWNWPAWLRTRWLALALLIAFLMTYEAFDLWASPWWTAWILVGYFAGAAAIDALFRGASFCQFVCPIGQFQQLQMLATETSWQRWRRQADRLARRPDVVLLLILFVFAAFTNALGMVEPVARQVSRFESRLRWPRPLVEGVLFVGFTILLPALLLGLLGYVSPRRDDGETAWPENIGKSALALVPLGVAMWTAHWGFHFLSGPLSFVPVFQRFAFDWGLLAVVSPNWAYNCCAPVGAGLLKFEILALDAGLLGSLYLGYRFAAEQSATCPFGFWRRLAPHCLLAVALFALGIWMLFQPMEMRGILSPGGAG